jgi:hypothetical protein
MITEHQEQYEDTLLQHDVETTGSGLTAEAKEAEETILQPYEPKQLMAQRFMALVYDPDTGRPMNNRRVAELCHVDRTTLHRWINDPRTGGRRAWYTAVSSYVNEFLDEKWAHLVKVQLNEALTGTAKIGAFRNIARILGKIGPDVEVHAEQHFETNIHAQIVVRLPDNGRSKASCPDEPGRFRVYEPSADTSSGGNGGNGGNGDGDK